METARHILVVEDSEDLATVLGDRFRREGYSVEVVHDGESALRVAEQTSQNLILLDVMLPGISGFDVCRELRQRNQATPILMLTARSESVDKIVGLRLGADDYVTKPFDMGELVARVRRAGVRLDLTAREFLLLRYLVENRGVVQSRDALLKAVWNYDASLTTRTLDVHIAWLRQKLEKEPARPRHIITVRGLGYKFVE
jgi:two-component system, OmpR family, alkaline phosphatase synthesis response regulator PhoP